MKFGVTIKDALHEEWSKYYVDYAGLKKFIKSRQAKKQWDDNDEKIFVRELDKELQKVADFQERKVFPFPFSKKNPVLHPS
jgi:SPX domain protein involved in polyphosphate accumulation